MKKMILGLAACSCALAVAAPAYAQTRRGLEVGVEAFGYGYKEFDEGSLLIRDDGSLVGLHISYVQPIAGGLFARAILTGAAGSIDYDPLDEPVVTDIEQRSGRFELQLGYDFMLRGGANITPFTGLGHRLHEDLSGGIETVSGLQGYDRELEYQYVPVGVAAGIPVGGRKRLTLSAQYNFIVGGQSTSRFSELDPEFEDLALEFNGGHGVEASATLSLPVGRKHLINVGPFIRHWDLEDSETLTIVNPDDPTEAVTFVEPENRTTEVGLRVSFSF